MRGFCLSSDQPLLPKVANYRGLDVPRRKLQLFAEVVKTTASSLGGGLAEADASIAGCVKPTARMQGKILTTVPRTMQSLDRK